MKLYIWRNVLADYTSGIAFAVAKSPEHAREVILAEYAKREKYPSEQLVADISRAPDDVRTGAAGGYCWGGG